MNLIKEITDKDFFPDSGDFKLDYEQVYFRRGARVILERKGKVALIHSKKQGIYKIPGGGVDKGETPQETAKREAKEEAGYEVEIGSLIGVILEYREQHKFVQISYCFSAKALKETGQRLTESELKNKFDLMRVPIKEALSLAEQREPTDYRAYFMGLREYLFMKKYTRDNASF